ncbi:MAG: S8 family serine peptidase [Caldilineaceae bacterium]
MIHCPLCGQPNPLSRLAQHPELTPAVILRVQDEHPGWFSSQGICPGCAVHYAERQIALRSAETLHYDGPDSVGFPYYHPNEMTILSLPERLPDHGYFTGRGVTIAFIDSGYYPNPDLIDGRPAVLDLEHSNADVGRTRRLLEQQPLRIREYLNLFEGSERTGIESPSLWSDAPNSWHGQMTSAVAVGNGLLSGGYYRGFAPEAELLPIKIGRADGAIPEHEIARALQWLLREDNWLCYDVRVVNISVGGDRPQGWWENDVCVAVEELTRRGVVVVAAAGNSNRGELVAPAQAPSAVTVGGVDDGNRRIRLDRPDETARYQGYHHNWGPVYVDSLQIAKPEVVAPAKWVPAPVLPVSPIFREMWILGQAWDAFVAGNVNTAAEIAYTWRTVLDFEPEIRQARAEQLHQALLERMNAHKFIHRHYQHVDGTSVAAPQVAAVAAQMIQANPNLNPYQIKQLITASAHPLYHLPPERKGEGLLVPASAVAYALRASGGLLYGYPISGERLQANGLRNLSIPVKVATTDKVDVDHDRWAAVYLGCLAPAAHRVALTGSFNGWRHDAIFLQPARNGWWHGVFLLPPGGYLYRFWITDADGSVRWICDAENALRAESGFRHPHSVINI